MRILFISGTGTISTPISRRVLEEAGAALIVDTPEEILALIRKTRI